MEQSRLRTRAIKLALIAVMAATLEGGKLALSAIPNVEIVTLLCAVYGYVFGWSGVAATYIFVGLETLIWGVNTWVVTYIIHWGAVAIVFTALGKAKIKSRIVATVCAVIMTVAFGVLSSLVDTGLLTGFFKDFWRRFAIIYARGAAFYITQIICNLILFVIAFSPLVKLLDRICPARFKGNALSLPNKSPKTYEIQNSDCNQNPSNGACLQNPIDSQREKGDGLTYTDSDGKSDSTPS